PPATATNTTTAGPGLTAGEIGTTKRSDGERQLTYNGHPLYRAAADRKPGDTNGQGLDQFGAKWYVLNASGAKIDDDQPRTRPARCPLPRRRRSAGRGDRSHPAVHRRRVLRHP